MTAIEPSPSSPRGSFGFRLLHWLAAPVDIASLAVFRILFGGLMAAGMVRFLHAGWVRELYVAPKYYFAFAGFEWVRPWPDEWMHFHFIALLVLALGIALGFCYRICAALFFAGIIYVELLDKTNYLNHYYLVSLISFLLIFLPAHRALSVDAWLDPRIRTALVPAWTVNVLRFQIAAVYFFAGIAKLSHDWLFAAQPLRIWLAARSDLPLLGTLLNESWAAFTASWIGAAYDLAIVPLLCWRRTRPWAYLAVIGFHLMTLLLFNIGMFPWIMILTTLILFPSGWPRRWLSRWLPGLGPKEPLPAQDKPSRIAVAGLAIYVAVQLLVPLRPLLQHDNCAWTGRGFNFSWRVMIVEKSGHVEFTAFDPATSREWKIPLKPLLTARQQMMMAQDPWMIRSLARHLADELRGQGHARVQIRATAYATLNGRPSQLMIDPHVDLAGPLPPIWILPLKD